MRKIVGRDDALPASYALWRVLSSYTGMHMGMRRHRLLTATATVEDTGQLTLGVVPSLTGVHLLTFELIHVCICSCACQAWTGMCKVKSYAGCGSRQFWGTCGCIRYNGGDRYSGAPERDASYSRSAGAAVPLERSPDRYGRAPAGGPER